MKTLRWRIVMRSLPSLLRLTLLDVLLLLVLIGGLTLVADSGGFRNALVGSWWDARDHLGAEYDSIARAVRAGRGFADPFREATGPTAWMPPILPYVLAGLYWVFGDDREGVVVAVVLLQAMVVWLTAALVIAEARRRRVVWAGYAILVGGLLSNYYELFQKTHDVWLNLLVVNLLWLGLVVRWRRPRRQILWGVFGGFAALCSPVLGAVWAALTTVRWLPPLRSSVLPSVWRQRLRSVATVAVISVLVVLPWTIRNRVVLGRWMPIKSNGMFELWQSQCLDDDGVLDWRTTSHHPWPSGGQLRQDYQQLGEIAFVDHYGQLARQAIAAQPWRFIDRVAGRLLAATVWYMPHDPHEPWLLWLKRLVFPLPLLSAVYLMMVGRLGKRGVAAAFWIIAATLAPYILVSYYERYAVPLVGLKMLLVLYAVADLGVRQRFRRSVPKSGNDVVRR